MSNVICPNCEQTNTPGSKFCNNCGNRLPPSDEIICPNCQTPNAATLFYCDNCGSRLVKETLPTEAEADSEDEAEPTSIRPSDLFGLPMRKPGDTGKLDANTVPDWLRTGKPEDELESDSLEATDEESLLEQAESEAEVSPPKRGATDELPDWLITDSVADIFQPPSEISTEAFLQMTDEAAPDIEEGAGITDELNLPDWLTDAVRETGSLIDEEPTSQSPAEADELPDPFRTATDIPDWLAEFGGAAPGETSDDAPDGAEETPTVEEWGFSQAEFDETPDWLSDDTPVAVEETVTVEERDLSPTEFDESPDWLVESADPEVEEPVTEPAEMLATEMEQLGEDASFDWQEDAADAEEDIPEEEPPLDGLAEWGTAVVPNAELPEWYDELNRPKTQDLADWLLKMDEVEEPEFITDEPESSSSVADRLTDWVAEGEIEDTAVSEEAGDEEQEVVTGMLTGWLSELDDSDEEEITEDADDEKAVTGLLTGWLSEFDEPEEAEKADDELEEEILKPGTFTNWLLDDEQEEDMLDVSVDDVDEAESGMFTNWLSEADEPEKEMLTEEAVEPSQFTNWLTETDSADEASPVADDLDEGDPELGEFTSWLTDSESMAEADSLTGEKLGTDDDAGPGLDDVGLETDADLPDDEDFTEDALKPGEFTGWLTDSEDVAEADSLAGEKLDTGKFTEWLTNIDDDANLDLDIVGSESDDPFAESELDEDDLEPGEFTGWLTDSGDFAEPDSLTEGTLETGEFTDWLSDVEQEDEAASLEEESPESEPEPGMFTNWLAEADTASSDDILEDEQEKEEKEIVTGMLTGWLSDLEEPEADSSLEEDDEEEKVVTGMLTGWLSDLEEPETDDSSEEDDEEEKVVTGMLTGWLSDLDASEEDDFADDVELEPGMLTDWLAESDEIEGVVEKETAVEPETFSDWLGTVEETDSSDSDVETELAEVPDSLTDWLTETQGDGSEEQRATLDISADDLPDQEVPEFVTEPEAGTTVLPDWFSDLDSAEGGPVSEAEEFAANLFEDEDASIDLDWLETTIDDPSVDVEPFAETADSVDDDLGDDLVDWVEDDAAIADVADWMSDLDSMDTGDLTTLFEAPDTSDDSAALFPDLDEVSFEDEAQSQVEEAALEQSEDVPPPESPVPSESEADDLSIDLPLSEEDAAEAFPDWLTDLEDAAEAGKEHQSELIQEDLPNWLSNMKPSPVDTQDSSLPGLGLDANLIDDLAEIPEELSGADLPDWLQGIPISTQPGEDGVDGEGYSSDIPDWLRGDGERLPEQDSSGELRSILSELPPPRDLREELAKAEIPEWLDALKPKDLTGAAPPASAVGPTPESGPLSGVQGAIDIAPIIAATRIAQELPLHQLTATAEQQQQITLLQQLAQDETVSAETAVTPRRHFPWGRLLLSLILLAVMSAPILLGNRLSLVRNEQLAAPAPIAAVASALTTAAEQSVLVAFDYTPALGGELDAQAEAVMAQLAANGNQVIPVSQYAAGTAVAANYSDEPALFIPGEAIGLRQLGNCMADGCKTLYGRSLETELSNVGLIIVLTGERKNLINWLEQVKPQVNVPILAGTTQTLAPIALSYVTSEQLQGVLSYQAAIGRYEDVLPTATAAAANQRILTAQMLVQLVLVVILLFGLVWQIIRASTGRKS